MGWAQSVMCISGSNSSSFTKINTLLVVYRICPLSTDNFSHLWCITSILFLLHFLYLRLWLPALIVLGNPWVCTWRKWTRETASHFIAGSLQSNPSWFERKFRIHSSPQGLSLLEGKVRRMLNGGGVSFPLWSRKSTVNTCPSERLT